MMIEMVQFLLLLIAIIVVVVLLAINITAARLFHCFENIYMYRSGSGGSNSRRRRCLITINRAHPKRVQQNRRLMISISTTAASITRLKRGRILIMMMPMMIRDRYLLWLRRPLYPHLLLTRPIRYTTLTVIRLGLVVAVVNTRRFGAIEAFF